MNDRTPLINEYASINDDPIPNFIRKPSNLSRRFIWTIPNQETKETRRDRFFSIKICYGCMLLSSISFTVTLSSMWPFLLIIDESSSTSFYGWVVSVFSIGQLIASPLFGYMANRIQSHKIAIIVTLIISIIGNLVYFYLEPVGKLDWFSPKYWMLVSRFIMGLGAATAAVIRSYVSSATNVEERTSVLANISACQGLGFIIGPIIQAGLVPIGYPGLVTLIEFPLNMYTSPAFLSLIIYLILLFLLIFKFTEYSVLDYNVVNQSKTDDNIESSLPRSLANLPPPDYVAIVLALFLFFSNCFIFSFLETLTSPLTTDMYAWSKKKATLYNGLILGGFGFLAVIAVLLSKMLAKKYKEKHLMLVGYVILLISMITLLPWGNELPPLQIATFQPHHRNTTTATPLANMTTTIPMRTTTEDPPTGCPIDYDWCYYTPIIQLYQFLIGFALLVAGYSATNVMSFAIYSKLIGPKPQGLMMGILTSFGSLSRTVGPIAVSYIYDGYGPRVTFISLAGLIILIILTILLTYKRYEPYRFT